MLLRLQADDRLVQKHVVKNAAEGVFYVAVPGGVFHGLRNGYTQRAGRIGMLGQNFTAGFCPVRRAGEYLRSERLYHYFAVGFLIVAYLYHIDGALQAEK